MILKIITKNIIDNNIISVMSRTYSTFGMSYEQTIHASNNEVVISQVALQYGGLDILKYSLYVFCVGCISEMWKDPFIWILVDAKKHGFDEFSRFFMVTFRT